MILLYALVGAGVVGCALHMMLSRNLVRLLLGVSLLSTGVNILLFVAGGMGNRQPPLIRAGETQLGDSADPLTQALILTAIVIGFALTVVFAAFVLRAWRTERTVDGRAVDAAERLGLPRQEDDA